MCCSIEGCDRPIKYKADQLCNMHYFRRRRNGHFEKLPRRHAYVLTKNGAKMIYSPDHPLANKDGRVLEHRILMWDKYGENLPPCEECGDESSWEPYGTQMLYRDGDKFNVTLENIRVICTSCRAIEVQAPPVKRCNSTAVTYKGETKTPEEWSRVEGVTVSGRAIKQRLLAGKDVKSAIFDPPLRQNS